MPRIVPMSCVVLAVFCADSALSFLAVGQEKLPSGTSQVAQKDAAKSQPITLFRCRIQLIDDVTLAGGRTGILAFVKPIEGESVKKGDLVASLMDDAPRAAWEVAKKEASNDIEVRYAKKAFEVAEAEHEAAMIANRRLKDTVPEIEVKKLKLAADRGNLQIEKAEHDFEIVKRKADEAKGVLKTYWIDAPFDGVVTKVFKASGEAVREGDPILELSNTSRVRVEGKVNIKDVWNVAPGRPVQVQLDIPEVDLPVEQMTFNGRIVFVDVKVEPVTKEVRVWAEVANRDNVLRAGLTAKMTIDPSGTVPAQPALGKADTPRRTPNN